MLTNGHHLYACGSNTYGQLGVVSAQSESCIHKVTDEIKFESIACGSEHSFAVASDTGELYAWGLNFKGQLGLGDFENRSGPCQVISFISCNS